MSTGDPIRRRLTIFGHEKVIEDLKKDRDSWKEKAERLQDGLASKYPHSFVTMKWACGHTGFPSCNECFKKKCADVDAWRSHAERLAEALEDMVDAFGETADDLRIGRHGIFAIRNGRRLIAAHAEMVKEKP